MVRYSRTSRTDGSLVLFVILGVTAWVHQAWMVYALIWLVVMTAAIVIAKLARLIRFRRQEVALKDIDVMDGLAFERCVADMLHKQGFSRVRLTEHYDLGVDIVAEKHGTKWGIQVKRYNGLVKANAVRQVVTALNAYGCERSMVITNSTYSNTARRLAQTNHCVLVDRARLSELI